MSDNVLRGKVILVVNPGSYRKKFILEKIKELGAQIVCLNKEKTALAEPYIKHWILADLENREECLAQVKAFIAEHPDSAPQGVVTFWEECVFVTAYLAEQLKLIGIPLKVVEQIKNKSTFRSFCRENNLPAPKSGVLHTKKDITALNLNFPLVIKPIYGASSAFVVKVNGVADLEKTLADIKANIASYELAPEWQNWDVMAEEYIDGQEVDVDILLQDGKCVYYSITDNDSTNEPYFVETGECSPSALPKKKQDELIAMATMVLEKLGVKNGCVHFEAKYSSQGPVPIEINLRMGGGDVYVYSKTVWGVDLVENTVKIALGIPTTIKKPAKPLTYLAARQFLPDYSGKLTELTIDKSIYDKPYFVELFFTKKIGDIFLAPPEGYDSCVGWFTASGKNVAEARRNVEEGLGLVHYTLEKLSPSTTASTVKN